MITDPACVLLPPCDHSIILLSLAKKIIIALSTLFDLPMKEIHPHLQKATLKQFGKVQHLDGGDKMNASELVPAGDNLWGATFVHISFILFWEPLSHVLLSV